MMADLRLVPRRNDDIARFEAISFYSTEIRHCNQGQLPRCIIRMLHIFYIQEWHCRPSRTPQTIHRKAHRQFAECSERQARVFPCYINKMLIYSSSR